MEERLQAKRQLADARKHKGVRLLPFLLFDLVAFAVVVGVAVLAYLTTDDTWLRQVYLHWLCVVYALCGLPWLVLKVPLMYLLVLHVVPTGANRAGETVVKLNGSSRLRLRKARSERSAKVAPAS